MKVRNFAFAALLGVTALGFSLNANAEGGNPSAASGAGVSAGSSVGASGGSPGIGGGSDENTAQGASHPTVNTSTVRANGSTSAGTFDEASTPASDSLNTSDSSSSDTIPLNNSREVASEDVPNANTTDQSIVNNNRDPNAAVSGNADAQGRQGESDTLTTSDSSSSDTIPANGARSNTTNVDGSEPKGLTTSSTTTTIIHYDDLEASQISSIQSQLRTQGFRVGSVDGIWGPRTAAALREYQAQNNLVYSNTGIDSDTAARLNLNQ